MPAQPVPGRTAQQPHEKFVSSDYNTEFKKENDDMLEEIVGRNGKE